MGKGGNNNNCMEKEWNGNVKKPIPVAVRAHSALGTKLLMLSTDVSSLQEEEKKARACREWTHLGTIRAVEQSILQQIRSTV